MRSLLDTHAFLWFITGDERLSATARRAIESPDARVLLSIASVWEIAIKVGIGRLPLPSPVRILVPEQMAANAIGLLPIEIDHALEAGNLPQHHRDPFDRMLVIQALLEEMPIVSADPVLDRYGVQRIW